MEIRRHDDVVVIEPDLGPAEPGILCWAYNVQEVWDRKGKAFWKDDVKLFGGEGL